MDVKTKRVAKAKAERTNVNRFVILSSYIFDKSVRTRTDLSNATKKKENETKRERKKLEHDPSENTNIHIGISKTKRPFVIGIACAEIRKQRNNHNYCLCFFCVPDISPLIMPHGRPNTTPRVNSNCTISVPRWPFDRDSVSGLALASDDCHVVVVVVVVVVERCPHLRRQDYPQVAPQCWVETKKTKHVAAAAAAF